MGRLPAFVLAERDALRAEIYAAFAGVTREGGVSWTESREIDNYVMDQAAWMANRAAARAKDIDTNWEQVVEDPEWNGATGIGGWNFVDEIGFRYYLPVAMARFLRGDWADIGLIFSLTLGETLPESRLQQWSLLDERQRRCVKRFIEYQYIAESAAVLNPPEWESVDDIVFGDLEGWEEAYKSYWKDVPSKDAPKP